jgi:hypothetical protein
MIFWTERTGFHLSEPAGSLPGAGQERLGISSRRELNAALTQAGPADLAA